MPFGQSPKQAQDLKEGDILVFHTMGTMLQKFIQGVQAVFSRQDEGHSASTHVAIVARDPITKKLIIAHNTEADGVMGLKVEPLEDMEKRDKAVGRPYQLFRPREDVGLKIAESALAATKLPPGHKVDWSYGEAVATFMMPAKKIRPWSALKHWVNNVMGRGEEAIKMKQPKVMENAVCSMFGLNMIKMGVYAVESKTADKAYYKEIESTRTRISPKALESLLYRSAHWEHFCSVGKVNKVNSFEVIKKEIQKALPAGVLKRFNSELEVLNKSPASDLEKTYFLLKKMLPVLDKMGGGHKSRVIDVAKSMGIYHRDVKNFDKDFAYFKALAPEVTAVQNRSHIVTMHPRGAAPATVKKEDAPVAVDDAKIRPR